jgi:ATPase subunit of ABC transporter with duplicated ATPase domains
VLTADRVSLAFGPRVVLTEVSVEVPERTRLGVVGPNGIGKTTLLRVLAGELAPDSGRVGRSPRDLRVGHLPQEPDAVPGETLMDYLARRTGVAAAEARLDDLTARLERDPDVVGDYSDALERYLALGGDDLAVRAGPVLAELGLPADRLGVPMTALSGGQAARATLAVLLLARQEVLLLDEPTNNLDFPGLARLERFVAETPSAVVVVSHDREFLDRSVTRILELTEPEHRAREWAGGWSDFVRRREEDRALRAAQHGRYTSERDRLQQRMRRQRAWSEEGVRREQRRQKDNDRIGRQARMERSEQQASKVRATERAIERLEEVDKPWEAWELRMTLSAGAGGSQVVARLDGAVAERGSFRLGPVDLELRRGDRVVITGPNGGGKTTLLEMLLGRLAPVAGARTGGTSVRVGEIDQPRAGRPDRAVVDDVAERTGVRPQEIRSLLAKFGLDADAVALPGDRLSPGQRTRVALAELVAAEPNVLVLDEPTNHLDLEAIEQLEDALMDYTGTVLLVTHDRRLLERVHVTRRLQVEDGTVREVPVPA